MIQGMLRACVLNYYSVFEFVVLSGMVTILLVIGALIALFLLY